jgi:hypothetical protein
MHIFRKKKFQNGKAREKSFRLLYLKCNNCGFLKEGGDIGAALSCTGASRKAATNGKD